MLAAVGTNLLHAAATAGCYDIASVLVTDFGVDSTHVSNGIMGAKRTPYGDCQEEEEMARKEDRPSKCDPDRWLATMEEALEKLERGETSGIVAREATVSPVASRRFCAVCA